MLLYHHIKVKALPSFPRPDEAGMASDLDDEMWGEA